MKTCFKTLFLTIAIISISSCSSDDVSTSSNLSTQAEGKWRVQSAVQRNGAEDWDFDGVDSSDWVDEQDCIGFTTLEFTADGRMITEAPTQTLSFFGIVFEVECLPNTVYTQDVEFRGNTMTVYSLDSQGDRFTEGTSFRGLEINDDIMIIPDFYNHEAQGVEAIVDFTFIKIN